MPTFETFGARLAVIRQRFGWNVSEAAVECGLKASTWASWEDPAHPAHPRDLLAVARKIADRTGCDQAWLMGLPPSAGMLSVTTGEQSDAQGELFPGFRDRSHLSLVTR